MRKVLIAAASAAALAAAPSAFADNMKKEANPAASGAANAGVATAAAVSVETLTPNQLPSGAAIVAQDNAPLGAVTSVFVNQSGKVSSLLVTPAGAAGGKKVAASQVTLANGRLVVAMTKAAFDALPAAS